MKKLLVQIIYSTTIGLFIAVAFAIVRKINHEGIIFYQGIETGLVCFSIMTAFVLMSGGKIIGKYKEAALSSLLPGLLIYMLFISLVPTIIDRSVSITVLGKLAQCGDQGATLEEINKHFLDLYVGDGKAVKVRLKEQLVSGNIINDNLSYRLTNKGEAIVTILHRIGRIYSINMSYINGGGPKSL